MRNSLGAVELNTKRLHIREWCLVDAEALYAFEGRADVAAYQSYEPKSLADCEAYITEVLADAQRTPRRIFDFAVSLRGAVVGRVGLG